MEVAWKLPCTDSDELPVVRTVRHAAPLSPLSPRHRSPEEPAARGRRFSLLTDVHVSVYTPRTKHRELEEKLKAAGWILLAHGANHDVWTDGERQEPVPRHREINERLARAILRRTEGKR